jgi:hypothetical protein
MRTFATQSQVQTILWQVRLWLLACILVSATGCNYLPWPDTFGAINPPASTRGINGLGVHKRMWETTGARILKPKKLSPRLDDVEVILLIGTTYEPPGKLAREWLEKWLSSDSGRTVIYFGRDFECDQDYRNKTLPMVAADKQLLAREALATRQATDFVDRITTLPEDTFCRWFFIRPSARGIVHTQFSGPWAEALDGLAGEWPTHTLLEPPGVSGQKTHKPSWLQPGKKSTLKPVTNPFFMQGDDDKAFAEKEVQRSNWKLQELDSDELWAEEFEYAGDPEILLAGHDKTPLIFSITRPEFEEGSRLLIVNNGAPFLNGALIKPLNQRISEMIIEECLPAKRVAFFEYGETGILISHVNSEGTGSLGLDMLTLWPLSAISMHAAILGLISFVVLLPILGRPQRLPKRSVTDFGLHVEAMGRMLGASRDLAFGVNAIREYFLKVRNETPPEWTNQIELPADRPTGKTIAPADPQIPEPGNGGAIKI